MPFPAMQATVVHKEGCCMYYVVGNGSQLSGEATARLKHIGSERRCVHIRIPHR